MSMDSPASDRDRAAAERPTARSTLGTLAVVLTVISVIAFVVLIIGSIADWKGFSDDPDDESTFADIVWSTFALGGLLALITGGIAWVRARGRGLGGDVNAGRMAVAWVVIAVVISLIVSALD